MANVEFIDYYHNIHYFLQKFLCAERISQPDYVHGKQHIEFYHERLRSFEDIAIEEFSPGELARLSYEECLYQKATDPESFNLLVLIGGLGAGKTTAIEYLLSLIERRQESLKETFKCNCLICNQNPIRVDCVDISAHKSFDDTYKAILKRIRYGIYNRIIDVLIDKKETSERERLQISKHSKVLRRLLIANDICDWADIERPDCYPNDLNVSSCRLSSPLLGRHISTSALIDIANDKRKDINDLTAPLAKKDSDLESSMQLTSLVLGFYLQLCSSNGPRNLVIVDNTDQLATECIEQLVKHLHSIWGNNKNARLLLPLRPSSIALDGFVRDVNYMYHYGPNTYEMMLHRVLRYILGRSRKSLIEGDKGRNLSKAFKFTPENPKEMDSLLIASYLYALVLIAGTEKGKKMISGDNIPRPIVHSDHEYLHNIFVGKGTIRNVSQTLGALVGTCGRYATSQLIRYFSSIYKDPTVLNSVIQVSHSKRARQRMQIGHHMLIGTLFGDLEDDRHYTLASKQIRLANLFRATTTTTNRHLPSLAKIRALAILYGEPRVSVKFTLAELARFGIPAERGIEALNYLHEKYRHLIWFSRNTDLQLKEEYYSQHVIISEQGLGYLRHVIGDFEYIWFCSRQIPPTTKTLSEFDFRIRLGEYRRLVLSLGETEWKQIHFNRALRRYAYSETDEPIRGELFTLQILYSSLERALLSAEAALIPSDSYTPFREEILITVESICQLIVKWQNVYKLCYGGTAYLDRYKGLISKCRIALLELLESPRLNKETRDIVSTIVDEWEGPSRSSVLHTLTPDSSLPPEKDFISHLSSILRGSVPVVRDFVNTLDKVKAGRQFVWGFFVQRKALHELLDKRLPSYQQLESRIRILIEQAQEVIESLQIVSSTEESALKWFIQERNWLRDIYEIIQENGFEVPEICNIEQMDELKRLSNNLIKLRRTIARHLGVQFTQEINPEWL